MTFEEWGEVVRTGTFLYDGAVICDLRIVRSPIRYGSGDWEDPPEIANDQELETFYVQYGSSTERGRFNAGGGGHDTLRDAMQATQAAPGIGPTVQWDVD